MLALAHHLLSEPGPATVTICPDGEHAKRFDIPAWLATQGFEKIENLGSTSYGGLYVRGDKTVVVNPRSGIGDVTGNLAGRAVVCECKGGTINSKHSGRQSLLRKGLLETVCALLALPVDGARQIAAVPLTPLTRGWLKSSRRGVAQRGSRSRSCARTGRYIGWRNEMSRPPGSHLMAKPTFPLSRTPPLR